MSVCIAPALTWLANDYIVNLLAYGLLSQLLTIVYSYVD